ncbi:MAG: hypothetical protein NT029_03065 [Armatimonadetes bacterium]|nr:hypothetical protein [Armatimonadota bacterium]
MLKIEDIHPCADPAGEYVVLQNHGLNTISLRGWVICDDSYMAADAELGQHAMYVFTEDIAVKPYVRIVLFTGQGANEWRPTTDGKFAYLVFWGKERTAWKDADRVYLLQPVSMRRAQPAALEPSVAARM